MQQTAKDHKDSAISSLPPITTTAPVIVLDPDSGI